MVGEWRGVFRVIRGGKPYLVTDYKLIILEHLGRSPSGILVYEGRTSSDTNHKRIAHAGADELLPGEIVSPKVADSGDNYKMMIWKPRFKRCVHWQPADDPRPNEVGRIDREGGHLYDWDVKITFTEQRAQMEVTVTALQTDNVFTGTLERT